MESYKDIVSTLDLIEKMSEINILKILKILRIKYKENIDMNFVTYTLPSLVMKLKIYMIRVNKNDENVLEINQLIYNILPLFDSYFVLKNFDMTQRNAFLNFCKTMTTNSI
jgi:hypothetical protein